MIKYILLCGFLLDLIFGDPQSAAHPVRYIGKAIEKSEKSLRKIFGDFLGGIILVLLIPGLTYLIYAAAISVCSSIHPILSFCVQVYFSYRLIACKSLMTESHKVYTALKYKSIEEARKDLSMIVGRDTGKLNRKEITKAVVETIAENLSDGVIAPLLFLFIGGVPLMGLYKAVNTLDSMVGYHNENYEFYGKAAARVDDVLNFLPSRISAFLIMAAAYILNFDYKNSFVIWKRDRLKHKSPNSAQTESALAGALNIQLAGNASYFGKVVNKDTIGDNNREIVIDDILYANRLMKYTSLICVIILFFILLI